MSQWLLWSYVVVMAAAVLWFVRWSRHAKGVPPVPYRVVLAILLWSGIWHLVMALGGGQTEVAGRPVDWARYVDWLVTAPLLVIALSLTATHAVPGRRRGIMIAMVAACLPMIGCGLVADLLVNRVARIAVYAIGVLPLLVLLGLIWGPLRSIAVRQPRPMAALYTTLALLLNGLWVGFPLVWILGPSGLGTFGELANTALFLALSVLMKVGWSLVDLGRLRTLSDRGELTVG